MKKLIGLATIVVSLMAATAAQAVTVTDLTYPFSATNSTVVKTPEGVHYGTYADGGAIGGSLFYDGLNGTRLGDLTDFSATFNYRQAGSTTGAAPYLRVFFTDTLGVEHDIILDPSYCATTTPPEAVDLTYQMVGGSVRFDDDGCDGVAPDNQLWGLAIDGYENSTITGLAVSQGFSTGTDVSALLRRITVNGETFEFTGGPPPGPTGENGENGTNGRNGAPGINGTTQIITRKEEVLAPLVCTGNTLRTIRAPRRAGEEFISAKAQLRGHKLPVLGRFITVDLVGRDQGNYNVLIKSKYRKGNLVRVVKTTRNLSVACHR